MTPSEMGRKGGIASSALLTPEQRKAKAKKAAKARWNTKRRALSTGPAR